MSTGHTRRAEGFRKSPHSYLNPKHVSVARLESPRRICAPVIGLKLKLTLSVGSSLEDRFLIPKTDQESGRRENISREAVGAPKPDLHMR